MARKRGKIGARKRRVGPREPNGRPQRTFERDDGTPELVKRKLEMAERCRAPGHAEATGHPLDMLLKRGTIDASEHHVGMRYRRLYRLCVGGVGAVAGGVRSLAEDDAEQFEAFRRMQAALSYAPGALKEVNRVCGLDEWPGWITGIRTSSDHAEMTAFLGGIKVLAA